MDLGLKGKKAIVTGGTRGIGRAIATLLAAEGAMSRSARAIARRSTGPSRSSRSAGVKAAGGAVDVADLAALRRWIGEAGEALGGLDIFVANVSALAQGMDEAAWRRGFEIDVMGTVFGIEAALPLLERSDAGAIVAVGSTAMAEIYGPTRSYAAVKAALLPYIKGLARNLAAKNIRANIVSPGNVFFEGGVWDNVRQNNPEMFAADAGAQPDRAHGHARGGRERGRVPRQPARQLHHRHELDHRRRADPARAVLTTVLPLLARAPLRARGPRPRTRRFDGASSGNTACRVPAAYRGRASRASLHGSTPAAARRHTIPASPAPSTSRYRGIQARGNAGRRAKGCGVRMHDPHRRGSHPHAGVWALRLPD